MYGPLRVNATLLSKHEMPYGKTKCRMACILAKNLASSSSSPFALYSLFESTRKTSWNGGVK